LISIHAKNVFTLFAGNSNLRKKLFPQCGKGFLNKGYVGKAKS